MSKRHEFTITAQGLESVAAISWGWTCAWCDVAVSCPEPEPACPYCGEMVMLDGSTVTIDTVCVAPDCTFETVAIGDDDEQG